MHFKSSTLAIQFTKLHPDLRKVLGELDVQVREWGLEQLVVTDAIRTPGEQEEIYWGRYLGPLVTEEEARQKARNKFTWHLFALAVDLRNRDYSREERQRIGAWLKERCPRPDWEFLDHDAGRGGHFHLGKRDWLWARDWQQKHKGAV